jgi:hypothetical protein
MLANQAERLTLCWMWLDRSGDLARLIPTPRLECLALSLSSKSHFKEQFPIIFILDSNVKLFGLRVIT